MSLQAISTSTPNFYANSLIEESRPISNITFKPQVYGPAEPLKERQPRKKPEGGWGTYQRNRSKS